METGIIEKSRKAIKNNFAAIPNDTIQNPNLSWKAKGLLSYLISLPEYWNIRKHEVAKHSSDGLTATLSAFKELEHFGYLTGVKVINNGKFAGINYMFTEQSIYEKDNEIWPIKDWSISVVGDTNKIDISKNIASNEEYTDNRFSANGFSANGFSANGFSANGFSANGFSANGKSITINKEYKKTDSIKKDSIKKEHNLCEDFSNEKEATSVIEQPQPKKKRKPNLASSFVAPSLDDVVAYFTEKGYSALAAKKCFDYYDSADWKDKNGNQVLNWKQKVIANWFKDEYLVSNPSVKDETIVTYDGNGFRWPSHQQMSENDNLVRWSDHYKSNGFFGDIGGVLKIKKYKLDIYLDKLSKANKK